MYGDHLPYLNFAPEEIENGSIYQTEYVVWSNYDMSISFDAPDLYSYELSSSIMSRLGMNTGLITKLHQNCSGKEDYMKYLEMLQYDMLYGKKECYGVDIGYTPTKITLGIYPPTVTSASNVENGLYVYGTRFTPFTRISINSVKYVETEFVDSNTLFLPDMEAVYGDKIRVCYTNGKRTTFRSSESYIADETVNPPPYDEIPDDIVSEQVIPEQ
jgi:hypothetical protein